MLRKSDWSNCKRVPKEYTDNYIFSCSITRCDTSSLHIELFQVPVLLQVNLKHSLLRNEDHLESGAASFFSTSLSNSLFSFFFSCHMFLILHSIFKGCLCMWAAETHLTPFATTHFHISDAVLSGVLLIYRNRRVVHELTCHLPPVFPPMALSTRYSLGWSLLEPGCIHQDTVGLSLSY